MIVKTFSSFRAGLTMVELVLVIVILGIVASVGASAIANVYESYIVQRAVHRASNKAELAAMQIANRLMFRISSSVIGRQTAAGTFLPLDQVPNDSYKVLEWIAYDNDSFAAQTTPGWSGYCDLSSTTRTSISTPGSNLGTTNTIIGELSSGSKGIGNAALVFDGHEYAPDVNYIANCMGFADNSCIYRVNSGTGTTLGVTDNNASASILMTDQYKLAWSAYALVPAGNTLTLRYNYQPWDGVQSASGSSKVLVDNFVSFRFKGDGDTIRFKLCIEEPIASDENVTICKEKAVIR